MEDKLLYKIHVTGSVQGVGFRWSAVNVARSLGIKGYVKNMSDGSVYLEAEGREDQLNTFIAWCKQGPGRSLVESVTSQVSTPVNYTEFRIEH